MPVRQKFIPKEVLLVLSIQAREENSIKIKMKPTIKSYFSGAGGLDLGLIQAGCEVVQSLEYDSTCCETLSLNFSHTVISKDIRNVTVLDQQSSHVMAFTYPCTKYSTIADIHGTRTGDELFLHAFRHVALSLPEMFVIENVPGMRKFKVVMECFTKIPHYYVNVFCPLDAVNWLPQKRPRLIVIASRKPFSVYPPDVARRVTLKDIVQPGALVDVPDYVYKRLHGKYRDRPIISDPDKGDLAPTCVAHYSKDVSTRLIKDGDRVRPYTVTEYQRLQGFPDSFVFAGSDRAAYKQIGNAVAVPVGRWIGQQIVRYFNR
jgi:DNA (cytosine-5)-methyltransferase 1